MDDGSRAAAQRTTVYEAHAADAFRVALHLTGRREDADEHFPVVAEEDDSPRSDSDV